VLIDIREDKTGQLVLSHRKARTIKSWDRVISANETGEIVNGFVKCRTKGGMIVDVFGIEVSYQDLKLMLNQLEIMMYVNKTMEFKVVKINHEFKTLLYLTKRLLKRILKYRKRNHRSITKGQVLEGV
jgi:small subunit ribosomal protein S1